MRREHDAGAAFDTVTQSGQYRANALVVRYFGLGAGLSRRERCVEVRTQKNSLTLNREILDAMNHYNLPPTNFDRSNRRCE